MRIALAGNPNSGKTTMFNALTGQRARVGNWGGVTVAEREGQLRADYAGGNDVTVVDLPGAYSMSPFTPEESITSQYIRQAHPDVIINIVDATNLSRNLFFTSQLLELGIPVVVALNKSDMAQRDDIDIDVAQLEKQLGCRVVPTVSTEQTDTGINQVARLAMTAIGTDQQPPFVQADIDLTDKAAVVAEDKRRYEFVNDVVDQVELRQTVTEEVTWQDKVDVVLTHKVLGSVIFAVIMFAVFAISQVYLGPIIADWLVGYIEAFQEWVEEAMAASPPVLTTIIANGIIGGVGAVVGFLPLVMVMYFLLALLEESGYMARVSALLDPLFKRVGLSGKSVVPVVVSTGCAIPGIMAARTIRDPRQRRATAMLASFIPCGAKVPVIALFAGAFFGGAAWVSWVSYMLGLALIFLGALLVKLVTGYRHRPSFFIIEFPQYKAPSLKFATMSMLERAKAFIIKAGTIILVCNLVVQLLQTYTWTLQVVDEGMENTSILASISSPFAYVLIPLGFGTWQLAAAAVTGFIAKENVVGTLAVVYSLTRFIDVDEFEMVGGATEVATTMGLTSAAALAYLFFNLYTPPCFASIGAMNSEMQDKRWLWGAIGLQLATGYTIAFFTYQGGTLILEGTLGTGFVPGLITVAAFAAIVAAIAKRNRAGFAAQYELHADAGVAN
ncbi:MAG: ferrous iron transporter B [Actinomycetaceae bacterium]|nr:ferrous iron transporter B [Actinomycetaceae bacterium]